MGRKAEPKQQPAAMLEILPAKTAQIEANQDNMALVASQHESMVRAVAAKVGYNLPADATDPDLIQRDISANMRRSVEACLEVGRGLAVLKASCGHGNFMARLDVLNIDPFVASRFIQSAGKFANLRSNANFTAAIGNQTKLFEMLVLDQEQIEELELTGQTGELSLDDVATMSVKELRAALREERKEGAAKDKVLADKNAANDKLRAQVKRIATVKPDQQLEELLKEVAVVVNTTLGQVRGEFRAAMEAMATHHNAHGGDLQHVMAGFAAQLQQALNQIRSDFNLPDPVGDGTPEWERWNAAQDAKATAAH